MMTGDTEVLRPLLAVSRNSGQAVRGLLEFGDWGWRSLLWQVPADLIARTVPVPVPHYKMPQSDFCGEEKGNAPARQKRDFVPRFQLPLLAKHPYS